MLCLVTPVVTRHKSQMLLHYYYYNYDYYHSLQAGHPREPGHVLGFLGVFKWSFQQHYTI